MDFTRRRSAFSVFRVQQKHESLVAQNQNGAAVDSCDSTEFSGSKTRKTPSRNRQKNKVVCKKITKVNTVRDLNNMASSQESEDSSEASNKKGMSKTHRLRQSLSLSSKKKRARSTTKSQPEVEELESNKRRRKSESVVKSKGSARDSLVSRVDKPLGGDESRGAPEDTSEAERIFQWLISPVKPNKFFSELWESKPLLISRHQSSYNDGWFSSKELDRILREHKVQFSVNLDVTTYKHGKRETHNPTGRAHAPVVWDFYENGASIRLLNPQAFSESVWKLTSLLQEYFGCFVGANVYLTPPGSQGFAPHYDDIEAFVIQLEGKKHWRLYNPRSDNEALPRFSSTNFSQDEIGEPILDTVLEAGDVMYFPRGTIHQAFTTSDAHSLHITLSTYQKNSWGDFLQKLIPRSLEIAFEEDPEFRKGLPLNYLDCTGVANSDLAVPGRTEFLRRVEKLMMKLASYAPVDATADQMALGLLHDSLPPVLTEDERRASIFASGASWEGSKVCNKVVIDGNTNVRLVRKGVARLVAEEDSVMVYHTLENSRLYHKEDLQRIQFSPEAGPSIERLFNAFPGFVKVDSLPHGDLEFKVDMVTMLYEKGILIRKET